MRSDAFAKLPFNALVFDLGGVIVRHDNPSLHRRLAANCAAPDALELLTKQVVDPRYYTGELKISDLHEALRRELGYSQDWNGFLADWTCHFGIDAGMLDLVSRLAVANRVMLFSNTDPEHWRYLVELSKGRLAGFEAYLSFEIGLAKPSLAAFQAVASRAGIDPERSLFVDDVPVNVEGARRAGFQAEVYVGQESLERTLGVQACSSR
ncbi:MAG: HAD-superfamily hydrolase, subfamily variant 3 [Rhodospirillales bacterium]|nr:HAD-superfamily hydrolase, subfamily variant 3 [Rhodospirillales bacterium]